MPRCSVSLLWDLWFFGKPVTKDAPFRKLTAMRIQSGSDKEMLIRRRISSREKLAINANLISRVSELVTMGYAQSRSLFNTVFLELVKSVHSVDQDEVVDRLRFGEITYLRFYDILMKSHRKKRRRPDSVDDNNYLKLLKKLFVIAYSACAR